MFDPRPRRLVRLTAVITALLTVACGDSDDKEDAGGAGTEERTVRQPPPTDGWASLGGDLFSTFHNRRDTSISRDNAGDLEEAWIMRTVGGPTGTMATNGDVGYVTSLGKSYAITLPDGDVLWEGPGATSSAAYHDGIVYIHDSRSALVALNAEDGEELWSEQTAVHAHVSGYSSPVVHGDLVYVGTSSAEEVSGRTAPELTFRGAVIAYDRLTGQREWRYWTVDEEHTGATVWSTVSIDPELGILYASTGNNYSGEATDTSDAVIALDMLTGDELWKNQVLPNDVFPRSDGEVGPDYDFGTNPVLFDMELDGEVRRLLGLGQKSGSFYVMDREDGETVWEISLGPGDEGTGGVFNNGAYDGERILVASNRGTSDGPGSESSRGGISRLVALDPGTGDILWERQLGHWVYAPITIANGVGYVAINTHMQAFNTETGEVLFEIDTGGSIASGVVVKDDHAYFGSGFQFFSPGVMMNSEFYALKLP